MKRVVAFLFVLLLTPTLFSCANLQKMNRTTAPETTALATIRLTFPEGKTVTDYAKLLEENGVCSSEDFITAVNSEQPLYKFSSELTETDKRAFRLEGYLFPDTYDFYLNENPQDVLERFLVNMKNKLTQADYARAQELGYTMDEIIALASIIQREASIESEMGKVSSVLHNRLNTSMQLQCDVTIEYIENNVKPFISGDKNRYNGYYNTYKCNALPVGAICNPGRAAINAALYPEQTDHFFFFTDTDGAYYYSKTFAEHEKKWFALQS